MGLDRLKSPSLKTPVRSTLNLSLWEAGFCSLMIGLAETYIPAFILALGFFEVYAGLAAVVPVLLGSLGQVFLVRWAKGKISGKSFLMGASFVQALVLFGLSAIAWTQNSSGPLIFGLISIYWMLGMSIGAFWNTWFCPVVPSQVRLGFFSRRLRVSDLLTMVGILIGGITLARVPQTATAFSWLFGFAGLFRLGSSFLFLGHSCECRDTKLSRLPASRAAHATLPPGSWGVIGFLFLVQFSAQISAPYFSPYMQKSLSLSYEWLMFLVSMGFLSRVFSQFWIRPLAQSKGSDFVLTLGLSGIVPLPLLWVLGSSLSYLAIVQIASGFFWTAYELGVFILILNRFPSHDRTTLLSMGGLAHAAGMFCGGALGALILGSGHLTANQYFTVFEWSAIARILPLVLGLFLVKMYRTRRGTEMAPPLASSQTEAA